jgi:hypothetical protein
MSLIFICIWQPGHIAIGQVSFGIAHPVSLEPFEARFRGADLGQLVKRDPAAQNAGYLRGLALRHVSPGNHDDKVSAKTCDASCPVPNARAAGRQEPPCSVSTLPPTQLPAQPKPRPVGRQDGRDRFGRSLRCHAAYDLTPDEVALMWRTAPPRMPLDPTEAGAGPAPRGAGGHRAGLAVVGSKPSSLLT